jgi:hypothetical protein
MRTCGKWGQQRTPSGGRFFHAKSDVELAFQCKVSNQNKKGEGTKGSEDLLPHEGWFEHRRQRVETLEKNGPKKMIGGKTIANLPQKEVERD